MIRRTGGADHVVLGGHVLLGALVIALALLLLTTPPDAIRLPRRLSEALIAGAAILLQLAAVVVASPGPPDPRHLVAALGAVLVTVAALHVMRLAGTSAWIAALYAWNPVAIYEAGVCGRASFTAAAAVALLLTCALLRRARRGHDADGA